MTTIIEYTIFKMPANREYQFPAVAIMQAYVNSYQSKCKANDASGGTAKYELMYGVDIDSHDWDLFFDAGLKIDIEPMWVDQVLDEVDTFRHPDMVVDLSDKKIDAFRHTGKHVIEICGHLCGNQLLVPFPRLRTAKPKIKDGFVWGAGGQEYTDWMVNTQYVDWDDLINLRDYELTGIICEASPFSYLAAAKGLAVVEIVTDDRPRNWLAKWSNSGYRVVTGPKDTWERQIRRAVASLERMDYVRWKQSTDEQVEPGRQL